MVDAFRAIGIDIKDLGYDQERIRAMFCDGFGKNRSLINRPQSNRCAREMGWIVIRLPSFGEFITSDNPVFVWKTKADSIPNGIVFPIAPKLALIGAKHNRVTFRNTATVTIRNPTIVEYRRVRDGFAQYINDTISGCARRFLFGQSQAALARAKRPRT